MITKLLESRLSVLRTPVYENKYMKRFRETRYLITEDGRVWSERTKRFLKIVKTQWGYGQVSLGHNNTIFVHRLVAEIYLENPNGYSYINHINNDRLDNRVENLEWCTTQMNIEHCILQRRHSHGEIHGMAKLKECDVLVIKKLIKENNLSQRQIAKKFNVSKYAIYCIKIGKTWKYLND